MDIDRMPRVGELNVLPLASGTELGAEASHAKLLIEQRFSHYHSSWLPLYC